MALFSMRVQVISRSDGRSAVGAAAYRAGAALSDAAGNRFDYTGKEHVELARIMAPEGAPRWVYDRETLWRNAEAAERKKNSQLAREIRIMIPREFSADQRINIITDFVEREFVSRGMIADVAWHNPKASDGQSNPHAHIMLTMRPLTPEGTFGLKSSGGRETQKRTTDWNSRELYQRIREAWEKTANDALSGMGSEARIDRRSYAERGIEKMPQPYLGVAARVRELRDRMYDRYQQFIAHRASSRAWGYAKKVLDVQMARAENRLGPAIAAAEVFDRFVAWADEKTAALRSGVPPDLATAQPSPSDKGIDR